jgi:hypothetical protein
MKLFRKYAFPVLCLVLLESCARMFGGPVTPQQRRYTPGGPPRQVRPDFLLMNFMVPYFIGHIVDFSSGAIYEPPAYLHDSLAGQFLSNIPGEEVKAGVNFAPVLNGSFEAIGELSFRNKLSATLGLGYTFDEGLLTGRIQASGAYFKAGARMYIFNSLMRRRLANIDLFLGASFIGSRYSRDRARYVLVDQTWRPLYYRETGLVAGAGITTGVTLRAGKKTEVDLGLQIPWVFEGQRMPYRYIPGFGDYGFVQGIFGLKYRLGAF